MPLSLRKASAAAESAGSEAFTAPSQSGNVDAWKALWLMSSPSVKRPLLLLSRCVRMPVRMAAAVAASAAACELLPAAPASCESAVSAPRP